VIRPRLIRVIVLTVLVLGAVPAAGVSPAGAATPCGKKIVDDWFDNGRIDRLYPLACYQQGIDAIPRDILDYADAQDVITRALQAAVHDKLDPRTKPARTDPKSPVSTDPVAAPDIGTSDSSSVPIPLLVLSGMSIVLVAAGGMGYVSRRRRAEQSADDTTGDL
jgi:hypothetical protein